MEHDAKEGAARDELSREQIENLLAGMLDAMAAEIRRGRAASAPHGKDAE